MRFNAYDRVILHLKPGHLIRKIPLGLAIGGVYLLLPGLISDRDQRVSLKGLVDFGWRPPDTCPVGTRHLPAKARLIDQQSYPSKLEGFRWTLSRQLGVGVLSREWMLLSSPH